MKKPLLNRQAVRFASALLVCLLVWVSPHFFPRRVPALSAENPLAASGSLAVTVLEFPDLIDPARARHVPIKVHLPTGDAPLPVVVVSHGAGGSWDANFAQARHLASHGYVVLALEHVGSNTAVLRRSPRLGANLRAMIRDAEEVLGRPRDVSFALDQAAVWNQTHAALRGRLDLEHVGVLGHSFGAHTVLAIAGVRPVLDWLRPPVPPGTGLGPDLRDARVDCGVALSPSGLGEPFFIAESYPSLAVPLLGITGSRDRPNPWQRRRSFAFWPPGDKYLIWLANAEHSAFSDATGSGWQMRPSRTRADAQPLVRAATLRFFDLYLKGDATARQQLTAAGLQPYLRGVVRAVEVLRQ